MITDQETGEQQCNDNRAPFSGTANSIDSSAEFDLETGEIDLEHRKVHKPKFSIPKDLLRTPKDGHNKSKCCMLGTAEENFTLSKKEHVITLQEVHGHLILIVLILIFVKF